MIHFKNFIVICFVLLLAGCGYTTGSTLPSNYRTIFVDKFKNEVSYAAEGNRNLYLPLLEVKARNSIIERFQFDGHLRISDFQAADFILRGSLKQYERSVLRYTDNNDVQEYRIQITVSLELFNAQTNQVEWVEDGFVGESTYFVTGPTAKSEDAAIVDALTDLGRRVVERTVENW